KSREKSFNDFMIILLKNEHLLFESIIHMSEKRTIKTIYSTLYDLGFFENYKLKRPYFHNTQIETLKHSKNFDESDCSFTLVGGRYGNGDDIICLKSDGDNKIVMVKKNTRNDVEPEFIGTIFLNKIPEVG